MPLQVFLVVMAAYVVAAYIPVSFVRQGRKGVAVLHSSAVSVYAATMHEKSIDCTACSIWLLYPMAQSHLMSGERAWWKHIDDIDVRLVLLCDQTCEAEGESAFAHGGVRKVFAFAE